MALQSQALPESDASLVARLSDGAPDAFEVLFERYFDPIYSHVAKCTDDADAVQVRVEQVWSAVLSSLDDFRAASSQSFAEWILAVAKAVVDPR